MSRAADMVHSAQAAEYRRGRCVTGNSASANASVGILNQATAPAQCHLRRPSASTCRPSATRAGPVPHPPGAQRCSALAVPCVGNGDGQGVSPVPVRMWRGQGGCACHPSDRARAGHASRTLDCALLWLQEWWSAETILPKPERSLFWAAGVCACLHAAAMLHRASCILRVARVARCAAYSAVRGQVHALRYVCTRCFVVLCDRCAALRTTGFSFSKSDLVRDVPYDPELVSLGLLPQPGCACALHTITTRPPGISLALQGWRSAPAKSTASSQRSTACRNAAQHAAAQHSTACDCLPGRPISRGGDEPRSARESST